MRWLAGVVANQRPSLIRQRTDDGNLLDLRFERKKSVILEQHHGLVRQLACMVAVFLAVEFLLIDL